MAAVPPTAVLRGLAGFAFVDDVAIAVTRVPEWTDADVIAYLEEITRLGRRVPSRASITDFQGAMLNAHQRKLTVDWLAREKVGSQSRTCLLTGSMMLRGAVTAYAWMTGAEGSAFDPTDRAKACAWTVRGLAAKADEVQRALEGCYRVVGLEPP